MLNISGWLLGVMGSAVFLMGAWAVSTFINWRVNHKVFKELQEVNRTLQDIRNQLEEVIKR